MTPGVCGPDITSELVNAISGLKTTFAVLSPTKQDDVCNTLDTPPEAKCTWDIFDLHNPAWLGSYRGQGCATAGATPSCQASVQVGTECYYAGSANYVIFGVMNKLCQDHFARTPEATRFTESRMLDLIYYQKGLPIWRGANFPESQQWASAGHQGWPSGGTPPAGDRANCSTTCPTPFLGPAFDVRWCPHVNPQMGDCSACLRFSLGLRQASHRRMEELRGCEDLPWLQKAFCQMGTPGGYPVAP